MAYLLTLWIALISMHLQAKDLGKYGQVFEIKEVNLLDYLKQKSQNLSTNEIDKLFENVRPQFKSTKILQSTTVYRQFYFDPTICAQEDILDHQDKVIVAKGYCVNPLEYTSLRNDLLFLDGDNASHIQWAKTQSEQAQWILVNGDPLILEEKEKRAVYFDQQGILATKLALTFLPAKVSQSNQLLLIEEFPIEAK
jgi:conjugal transfer pilus assembly protein TraW